MSLSPKSHRTVSKVEASKQAATTVGSKKPAKKEDGVLTSIQSKKLFGEKSAPAKIPLKPGRIVASRYSQNLTSDDARKRSFPENDEEESNRCEKRRVSRANAVDSCHTAKSESRVKKRDGKFLVRCWFSMVKLKPNTRVQSLRPPMFYQRLGQSDVSPRFPVTLVRLKRWQSWWGGDHTLALTRRQRTLFFSF